MLVLLGAVSWSRGRVGCHFIVARARKSLFLGEKVFPIQTRDLQMLDSASH
jgi:hypothetical protein